jgi:glutathione S-transferase
MASTLTFYHAPNTRSTGVLALLQELGLSPGVDYQLNVLNMKLGEQRQPPFLAINPMGKVPTLRHGDAVITEQVAIYIYLADLFAAAGLTPGLGDPLRGPFLRWLAFYGSCYEPAVVDVAMKRDSISPSTSPYGDFKTMFNTLVNQLNRGHYILGDRFTAADVLWGTALSWTSAFKLIPENSVVQAYIERVTSRPALIWATAKDAELAAAQAV